MPDNSWEEAKESRRKSYLHLSTRIVIKVGAMILGSLLVLSWVLVLKEVVHGQLVVNQASNQLDLPNLQRTGGGTFRFAINGVKISKVNEQKSNLIQLILDGTHGPIEIEHVTGTDYNEYKFVWANAGPSLEREVCFHYGLNNASW